MARRSKKHLIDPQGMFGLLIAIGVLWLLAQLLLSRRFIESLGLFILLGGTLTVAYIVVQHFRRVDIQRASFQKAEGIVEQQITTLARTRAQLVWQDPYGKPQVERWEREKDRFITQHIEPSLDPNELKALQSERSRMNEYIEARVKTVTAGQPAFRKFSDDMTPREFENFCAEELREAGWNARVTRQSGDQGVDVVAEKGDMRVVIQCKKHSRPVGNKSVQEVAAARAHEQARYAVVVTNNGYTPAAKQLASTNGILLLHFSELQTYITFSIRLLVHCVVDVAC